MSWRDKLLTIFSSNERVVKKVDELEKRQREIGHDLANIQSKLDPLRKLVEQLKEEDYLPDRGRSHEH